MPQLRGSAEVLQALLVSPSRLTGNAFILCSYFDYLLQKSRRTILSASKVERG